MKKILAFVVLLAASACTGPGSRTEPAELQPTVQGQRELGMLVSFLEGTWETLPQAKSPMRLRMAEFWKGKPNDHWLYVEYVNPAEDAKPVRQRIYRFSERGGKLTGVVYRLPEEPSRFAGEWRKAKPFEGVAPEQLREFENCRLVFERQHEALFAGGTDGKACRGDRPDVAYERSEFYLSSSSLKNLEQGYDAAGQRVAGEAGPWDFRKVAQQAR